MSLYSLHPIMSHLISDLTFSFSHLFFFPVDPKKKEVIFTPQS